MFQSMMRVLFNEKGAAMSIEILAEPETQEFINTHADILNDAMKQVPMSHSMRKRLKQSNWVFSGIKTFHELNEAFPEIVDENGNQKPFEQFLNDVQKIHQTYNKNYLRAEYNFITASAQMAAKWEKFAQDGDEYNLQYRTAGDDRVRPEHAALNRVTLPFSDPFWKSYFPPNGWNCRCTAVQVRKSKYPATPREEAMKRGEEALAKDKKGMFRFNPGAEQKSVPDYNPYTISKCKNCDVAKGKIKLAKAPDTDLCQACHLIHLCEEREGCTPDEVYGERLLVSNFADKTEVEDNVRGARALLASFPEMNIKVRKHVLINGVKNPEYVINGLIADRKGIESPKGVADGFCKAKEQGCQSIVIDCDMRMKYYRRNKLAQRLGWRSADFLNDTIKECYVIYKGKAILLTKNMFSEDRLSNIRKIDEELKKLET